MTYSLRQNRLRLAVVVVVVLVAFWTLAGVGQRSARFDASPGSVDRRSPLPADEQATIELFERSRGSVAYITTQARVVDPPVDTVNRVVPQLIARARQTSTGGGHASHL